MIILFCFALESFLSVISDNLPDRYQAIDDGDEAG